MQRPHKEVAILLRIRADLEMPSSDLIEYVRRCLKNGGIDLSLIDIQLARVLNNSPSLNVTGAVFTKKQQGTEKNIDNDPALRDDPTATTQSHIPSYDQT